MAPRTRWRVSSFSYAACGESGSEGTSAGGSELSSKCSPVASGDVDSMVLMRTIVRLRQAATGCRRMVGVSFGTGRPEVACVLPDLLAAPFPVVPSAARYRNGGTNG